MVTEAGTAASGLKVMHEQDLRALAQICRSLAAVGSLVKAPRLSDQRRLRTTSRVVANSSPRQTHERRVLHEGASLAFVRGDSEEWARAGGRGESRSLNHVVARTHPLADRMGRKSSGSLRGRVPG